MTLLPVNSIKTLNWLEINQLLQELNLNNYFVQKIKLTGAKELVLECYGKTGKVNVCLNLNPNVPLFYKLPTSYKQSNFNNNNHSFVKQLQKWLIGSKIITISQPGCQRIVMFHVKHLEETFYLLFKLWANKANLFWCNTQFKVMGNFNGHDVQPYFTFPFGNPPVHLTVREGFNNTFICNFALTNKQQQQHLNQEEALLRQQKAYLSKKNNFNQILYYNKNFEESKQIAILIQSQQKLIIKGTTEVSLINYYNNNQPITVKLQAKLNAIENANFYFKQYHKQQKAFLYAKHQLEILKVNPITKIDNTLPTAYKKTAATGNTKRVGLTFKVENYTLLVGRNANENDELLRYHANGLDYFFHAKGFSGGYVLVKGVGKNGLSSTVKQVACALAVHYSKAKGQADIFVSYTQVKYVKRLKVTPYNGLRKGAVSILNDKTLLADGPLWEHIKTNYSSH